MSQLTINFQYLYILDIFLKKLMSNFVKSSEMGFGSLKEDKRLNCCALQT